MSKPKVDTTREMETLHKYLKPGDNVYTILKRVSASGMTRHIEVVVPIIDERTKRPIMINLSYYVAMVLGYRRHDRTGGVIVGGCGMDMGFHLIYNLSRVMFKEDTNTDRSDHGYLLKQEWL